jgi:hypothetical protein
MKKSDVLNELIRVYKDAVGVTKNTDEVLKVAEEMLEKRKNKELKRELKLRDVVDEEIDRRDLGEYEEFRQWLESCKNNPKEEVKEEVKDAVDLVSGTEMLFTQEQYKKYAEAVNLIIDALRISRGR